MTSAAQVCDPSRTNRAKREDLLRGTVRILCARFSAARRGETSRPEESGSNPAGERVNFLRGNIPRVVRERPRMLSSTANLAPFSVSARNSRRSLGLFPDIPARGAGRLYSGTGFALAPPRNRRSRLAEGYGVKGRRRCNLIPVGQLCDRRRVWDSLFGVKFARIFPTSLFLGIRCERIEWTRERLKNRGFGFIFQSVEATV